MPASKRPKNQKGIDANNYVALIAVATVIVVVICGIIGKNLVAKIIVNTKVIASDIKAQNDLNTKKDNAKKLVDDYHNLGDKQAPIEHALPNTADFTQLVSIAENISNASGVSLKGVKPDETGNSSTSQAPGITAGGPAAAPTASGTGASQIGPQTFSFKINVQGPYAQIVAFSKNLDRSARPIRVTNLTMQGTNNAVKGEITASAYYEGQADISDKKVPVK